MYIARIACESSSLRNFCNEYFIAKGFVVATVSPAIIVNGNSLDALVVSCAELLQREHSLKVIVVQTADGSMSSAIELAVSTSKVLSSGVCWIHLLQKPELGAWANERDCKFLNGRFQMNRVEMFTVGVCEKSQLSKLDQAIIQVCGSDLLLTPNTFIAREKEIDSIFTYFEDHKLVTLTGCGGIGKTRISQQVAVRALGLFAAEVHYIRLAETQSPNDVKSRIRIAMSNVANSPEVTHLVVIDNCEHVIESVRDVLTCYDLDSLNVRILTTSREALGIAHEIVIRLEGLSFPDPNEASNSADCIGSFAALRLLSNRLEGQRGHGLTPGETLPAIRMVQLADGIPLAIEQVATSIYVLGLEACLEQMEHRLGKLSFQNASINFDPRHETMQAVLLWSYELLSDDERQAFGAASVFTSTFLASHLCELGEGTFNNTDIHALWKKSFVERLEPLNPTSSLRLLECVREFGRENYLEVNFVSRVDKLCCRVITESQSEIAGERTDFGRHDFQVLNSTIIDSLERQLVIDSEKTVELLATSLNLFITSSVSPRLLALYKSTIIRMDSRHPKELIIQNGIGVIHWLLGEHAKAKTVFVEIEEKALSRGLEIEQAMALTNIATLELNFGKPALAETPFLKASALFLSNREWTRFYSTQVNLLNLYIQIESVDEGLSLAKRLRNMFWDQVPDQIKPTMLLNTVDLHDIHGDHVSQIDDLIYLLDLMVDDGLNISFAPALLRIVPIVARSNEKAASFALGMANEAFDGSPSTTGRQRIVSKHAALLDHLMTTHPQEVTLGRMVEPIMRGIESKTRIRPSLVTAREHWLDFSKPVSFSN